MQAQLNPLAAHRINTQALGQDATQNLAQAPAQAAGAAAQNPWAQADQFQGAGGVQNPAAASPLQAIAALFQQLLGGIGQGGVGQGGVGQGGVGQGTAQAQTAAPAQGADAAGAAAAAGAPAQAGAQPPQGDLTRLPEQPANPAQQLLGVAKQLLGICFQLLGLVKNLLGKQGQAGAQPGAQAGAQAGAAKPDAQAGAAQGQAQAQTAGGLNPEAKDVKWAAQHGQYKWEGSELKINGGQFKGCTGKYDAEAKMLRVYNQQGEHVANQKVSQEQGGKPKVASPLALDINGEKGIQTSAQKVKFDIDGDGKLDQVNDVKEGVLAFGAGKNGKQLFGDNTDLNGDGKADGYKNGFEALRALAKKEGMYDEAKGDTKLDQKDIATLEKKYNFGLKKGYNAETESLAKNGVTEINLGSENARTTAKQGDQKDVILQEQAGATFQHNGQTKDYADVWHKI